MEVKEVVLREIAELFPIGFRHAGQQSIHRFNDRLWPGASRTGRGRYSGISPFVFPSRPQ